jgi:hypothetical protein
MAQGQMKGMNLFFIIFPERLPINYTTLKLATYLEDTLGNKKYHHLVSGIPNTGLISILFDHGSRINEMDASIFYNLYGEFAHDLHYFKVGHRPRRDIRKHEIASPGQLHSKNRINVSPTGSCINKK